ncbi:MAG: TonB-dependent receptor [Aquamicrobium sp.]|uniref:TonB-dependent receptor family protein n=1 Tax=Aquamicrobium sp. TaxID=1872579 RepID=UPI00349EFA01|nr:TonB-dependent receptor [Aquamicrobium sp.]
MQVKSERRHAGRGIVAGAAALLLVGASQQALAQSAAPGSVIVLDPIVISAGAVEGSTLSERLSVLPGGVALVEREEMAQSANLTASRALSTVPGVVVQDFFGGNDQPRIQIRGSGLQQNPVERGILMLQDGLPLNRADGSYIVGFLNPNAASALEIYRGYTANRLGANVLGGAINMISPTGSSRPGVSLSASGGSFGQFGGSASAGFQGDGYDVHLHGNLTRRDGFRTWNESSRVNIGGNVGIELSDNVKTRLFFGYTDLGFDVAGPLPKSYLKADPSQVHTGPVMTLPGPVATFPGPNVIRDKPRREAEQFLIGSRTTAEFDAHLFDIVLGYTYTDDMFRFPIASGIRTTKGGDFTGVLRYAYKPDASAALPLFESTAQYTIGSADRENYHNLSGTQGPLFGKSELDATSLSLNAGFNVPFGESFIVSPSIAYSHATRDNKDVFASLTRPTVAYNPMNPTMRTPDGAVTARDSSYERTYSGWSPSLAVSYRPDERQTFFGAVSRTFEPPTHDDLLATINGTPNSGPGRPNPGNPAIDAEVFHTPDLKAQTATTVEAGWRGSNGGGTAAWDATVYYSWVENELLNLRDASGTSLGAINAGKTRHFGVELGLTAQFAHQWSARLAYTYQDFRFRDHALYGTNRLAGAPRHVVNAVLQYDATEDWMLQGAVRWLPSKTPVDNMNTLYADPYAVVDLRTQYRVNEHVSLFAEVTNVFDTAYAASTLVIDQATRPDQAAFIPGDGRGFFVGVNAKF